MTKIPNSLEYQSTFEAVEDFRRTHPDGKVGLTTGCFDLTHPGHLAMLEACEKDCDFLVVCVTSDELIRQGKAKGSSIKPVMSETDRAAMVNALGCVDHVLIRRKEDKSLEKLSLLINPDIRFFGHDQKPGMVEGYVGKTCKIKRIEEPRPYSTSDIIQKIIAAKVEDDSYRAGVHVANDLNWYDR